MRFYFLHHVVPNIFRPCLAFLSAAALASVASAQVAPIGPFMGSLSESFETQSGQFTQCVNGRVFNNTADLCTPGNSGCNIVGGWSFYCMIFADTGGQFFGSLAGYAEYSFDTPVQRFGGMFGNNVNVDDGIAVFFDASGNQLASLTIHAPANCTWNWNGWDAGSGPRIKRVQVWGLSPQGNGGYLMMDSMQCDIGPGSGITELCLPGQGGTAICPCSNPPAGGSHACNNSSLTGGAVLSATGSASLGGDTLVFTTTNERPTATSVLLQGNSVNATGLVFGQGIRCVTGTLKRLYVKTASGGAITAPGSGDPSVSSSSAALGDTITAGTLRWYSVYYRDPIVLGGCPAASLFNITQTLQVNWAP